jgi:hypothetical protein
VLILLEKSFGENVKHSREAWNFRAIMGIGEDCIAFLLLFSLFLYVARADNKVPDVM